MGILLLNAYGRLIPRRRVIEGGLVALGILLVAMALSRPDQQLPRRRRPTRDRAAGPVAADLAAVDRRRRRVLRRDRLRRRRDPGPDPAPGGPAGGRPRPGVRRPEHAGVGRELPADPHRRPDRRRRSERRSSSSSVAILIAASGRRLDLPPRPPPRGRARLAGYASAIGRPDRRAALGAEVAESRRRSRTTTRSRTIAREPRGVTGDRSGGREPWTRPPRSRRTPTRPALDARPR